MWVRLWISTLTTLELYTVLSTANAPEIDQWIDLTGRIVNQCLGLKCEYPRPERFRLDQVVKITDVGTVNTVTEFTLFRCRPSSGCCTEATTFRNQSCTARKSTNICLKFEFDQHGGAKFLTKFVIMPNHTECHCADQKTIVQEPELYPMLDSCNGNIPKNCAANPDSQCFRKIMSESTLKRRNSNL